MAARGLDKFYLACLLQITLKGPLSPFEINWYGVTKTNAARYVLSRWLLWRNSDCDKSISAFGLLRFVDI